MKAAVRLLVLLAGLVSHVAFSQTVGRPEVKDLPDVWTQLVAYELKGLNINNGLERIPMRGAVFLGKSRDMLLVIESTVGGHSKNVNWVTMKCPAARPGYFTNDYGTNTNSRDTRCLVVNTRYSDKKYLEEIAPMAAKAVEQESLRFDKGQLVRAWSGIHNGTYLKVFLFKTSVIKIGAPASNDPGYQYRPLAGCVWRITAKACL